MPTSLCTGERGDFVLESLLLEPKRLLLILSPLFLLLLAAASGGVLEYSHILPIDQSIIVWWLYLVGRWDPGR